MEATADEVLRDLPAAVLAAAFYDAMWNATAGQYGRDLAGLLMLSGACFLAAAVLLHRRLPKPDR